MFCCMNVVCVACLTVPDQCQMTCHICVVMFVFLCFCLLPLFCIVDYIIYILYNYVNRLLVICVQRFYACLRVLVLFDEVFL